MLVWAVDVEDVCCLVTRLCAVDIFEPIYICIFEDVIIIELCDRPT